MSVNLKNFLMPLIFLSALIFSLCFGRIVPYSVKSFFYAMSLLIKEILIFSLPFVIFALVFSSMFRIGTRALKFILIIIPLICCSNFMNTLLTYVASLLFMKSGVIEGINNFSDNLDKLNPFFEFHLERIFSNDVALISGVVLGITSSFFKNRYAEKLSSIFDKFTKYFFKILIPCMPLFIMGTSLKLEHDGMLSTICSKYFPVLIVFIISSYSAVCIQYFILSGFNAERFIRYIKNVIPAIITGFGSMSSAAALPLSICAAEKNSIDERNASIIVPASVNIHLVGDCFFIPMVSLIIMFSFGMEIPSISKYLLFSIHFVLAKFAVAAVPGGGILVMIPILQNYLGFTSDMLGLITAIYVLFDPIITSCNVAGNGALAIMFDKISNVFSAKTR